MSKKVTLVATTLVTHNGRQYGRGMEFTVDPDDESAKDLVRNKQAEGATPRTKADKRAARQVTPAAPA